MRRENNSRRLLVLILGVVAALLFVLLRNTPRTITLAPGTSAPTTPSSMVSATFDVAVEVAEVAPMDNDGLFGEDAEVPDGVLESVEAEIGEILQSYLDAEFVMSETRFSDRPLDELLSDRAWDVLSDHDLAGLGALGISVEQVQGAPVTATARVLTSGSDAVVVAVHYNARAQVVSDGGDPVPLHQEATMVFVPVDDGWRVDTVEAVLDLPLVAAEALP